MSVAVIDPAASAHSSGSRTLNYAFVSVFLALGASTAWFAPLQLGVISNRFSLEASSAGGIVTMEMLCTAVAAFGLSKPLARLSLPMVALGAALVAFAAQVLSCLSVELWAFVAIRAAAGLAGGMLYATACYWASLHRHGVRMIGSAFILANVMFGASLAFLPAVIEQRGGVSLFVTQAGLFLLPVLVALFSKNLIRPAERVFEATTDRKANPAALVLLLACCALGNGGMQMLWTFSEGAAQARGFDAQTIGVVLGVTTLFSIGGSMLAAVLDRRWGMSFPLAAGLLAGAVAGIALAVGGTLHTFAAGMFIYGVAAFFSLPYQIGSGAVLDKDGRAATLAGATGYFAGAVGPVLGGLIHDHVSLGAVAWTASGACVVAALLALGIRRHIDAR